MNNLTLVACVATTLWALPTNSALAQTGPQPNCQTLGEGESCCATYAFKTIWCPIIEQWCPWMPAPDGDTTIYLGAAGTPGWSSPLPQDPIKHYCRFYEAVCPKSSSGACTTSFPVKKSHPCGSLVEPATPKDCGVAP
jgi:hypothetical protein